jgi:phosphohistidine phosphatase SixA
MRFASRKYYLGLLAFALLLASLLSVPSSTAEPPFKVSTVFFVRHAEKHISPPDDPVLTTSGKTRAKNLARILNKAGIKAILTSQFARTKETARPLAEAIGVVPTTVSVEPDPSDPNKVSAESIKKYVDRIGLHSGESVLVVGHTNTIPQIIGVLGGDTLPTISEAEFDKLFIVTRYRKDRSKVIQLEY